LAGYVSLYKVEAQKADSCELCGRVFGVLDRFHLHDPLQLSALREGKQLQ
jgi:hypothetical protein